MIDAQRIGRRLTNRDWLWRGLSLRAEGGQVIGIIGRNGSGKTTLLRALLGVHSVDEGHIERYGRAGYVPQRTEIALPFTVTEVVAMGRARHVRLFAGLRGPDRDAVARAIARVGLSALARRSFLELSGGERQLVLIARALAGECRTLILDEPCSALDLDNQSRTLGLLRGLATEAGVAVVFSTHNPDHIFAIADRVLALGDGGAAFQGAPTDVLTESNLGALYGVGMRIVDIVNDAGPARHAIPDITPRTRQESDANTRH